MTEARKSWPVILFVLGAIAVAVLGARAEDESSGPCIDACDAAEAACYLDCEAADDFDACEAACYATADACYDTCE